MADDFPKPPCGQCDHGWTEHQAGQCSGTAIDPDNGAEQSCDCKQWVAPTPDQAAEAGNPFTPAEQRMHDALMARVTEAIYIQAAATTKATNIPPEMLPRLIVCAAVHGVQKAIEAYQRREDQHHVIPFTREHRHDFQQRIIEDCTELQDAMGEAIDNLRVTVASMRPSPTLVQ
jgi:hypothetical protein